MFIKIILYISSGREEVVYREEVKVKQEVKEIFKVKDINKVKGRQEVFRFNLEFIN